MCAVWDPILISKKKDSSHHHSGYYNNIVLVLVFFFFSCDHVHIKLRVFSQTRLAFQPEILSSAEPNFRFAFFAVF